MNIKTILDKINNDEILSVEEKLFMESLKNKNDSVINYRKDYYKENKDKIKAYQKEYYTLNNTTKKKQMLDLYYKKKSQLTQLKSDK